MQRVLAIIWHRSRFERVASTRTDRSDRLIQSDLPILVLSYR